MRDGRKVRIRDPINLDHTISRLETITITTGFVLLGLLLLDRRDRSDIIIPIVVLLFELKRGPGRWFSLFRLVGDWRRRSPRDQNPLIVVVGHR